MSALVELGSRHADLVYFIKLNLKLAIFSGFIIGVLAAFLNHRDSWALVTSFGAVAAGVVGGAYVLVLAGMAWYWNGGVKIIVCDGLFAVWYGIA